MADPRQRLVEQIPRLRRYARALLGDPAQADELVQETLARALARLDRWRPGSDLRAWLFTLMHHLQVDRWRRARREAAALERASGPGSVGDTGGRGFQRSAVHAEQQGVATWSLHTALRGRRRRCS